MSTTTEVMDYSVIRLTGQSNAGGEPDSVANKIMANWNLASADGTPVNLFKNAVPTEGFKSRCMLKVWKEGDKKRASLYMSDDPDPINLDRGKVLSERQLNHGSSSLEIVIEGNYLFRITMECTPLSNAVISAVPPPNGRNPSGGIGQNHWPGIECAGAAYPSHEGSTPKAL